MLVSSRGDAKNCRVGERCQPGLQTIDEAAAAAEEEEAAEDEPEEEEEEAEA